MIYVFICIAFYSFPCNASAPFVTWAFPILASSHWSFHVAIFHCHFPVPLYSFIVFSLQIKSLMYFPVWAFKNILHKMAIIFELIWLIYLFILDSYRMCKDVVCWDIFVVYIPSNVLKINDKLKTTHSLRFTAMQIASSQEVRWWDNLPDDTYWYLGCQY